MAESVNPVTASRLTTLAPTLDSPRPVTEKTVKATNVQSEEPITPEKSQQAADQINIFLKATPTELRFSTDQETGRAFFKVVNKRGEVIFQVPSAEVLAMSRRLRALEDQRVGALLDKEG